MLEGQTFTVKQSNLITLYIVERDKRETETESVDP